MGLGFALFIIAVSAACQSTLAEDSCEAPTQCAESEVTSLLQPRGVRAASSSSLQAHASSVPLRGSKDERAASSASTLAAMTTANPTDWPESSESVSVRSGRFLPLVSDFVVNASAVATRRIHISYLQMQQLLSVHGALDANHHASSVLLVVLMFLCAAVSLFLCAATANLLSRDRSLVSGNLAGRHRQQDRDSSRSMSSHWRESWQKDSQRLSFGIPTATQQSLAPTPLAMMGQAVSACGNIPASAQGSRMSLPLSNAVSAASRPVRDDGFDERVDVHARTSDINARRAITSNAGQFGGVPRESPPPLCPPLILRDQDTHLTISMATLAAVTTSRELIDFDVFGPLSNPVFRATLSGALGYRVLSLMVPRLRLEAPWVEVRPLQQCNEALLRAMLPEGATSSGKVLELTGPDGSFYGLLVAQRGGSFWAIHKSLTVLVIEGASDRYHLQATEVAGKLAAKSSIQERRTPMGNGQRELLLDFEVKAGVDPLLVLACMLAVIVLF